METKDGFKMVFLSGQTVINQLFGLLGGDVGCVSRRSGQLACLEFKLFSAVTCGVDRSGRYEVYSLVLSDRSSADAC